MSERKLKCTRCGKWFKASDYKHLLCPACAAVERAKRAALPSPARAAAGPGQMATGARQQPAPGSAAAANGAVAVATAPIPAPAEESATPSVAPAKDATPKVAATRVARTAPVLTDAQRQAVDRRYLELATPREFDGIRRQIAGELSLPRSLVKQAVLELRTRLGLPSWWEVEQGDPPAEVVAAVRERYLPLLPLPPVGVHRDLARDLEISTLQVYRAIAHIRRDLALPQYNERPEAPSEEPEDAPSERPEAPVESVAQAS